VSRPVVVNADQTPQYSDIRLAGHAGGEFLFVPRDINIRVTVAPPPAPAPSVDREVVFWQSIQDSDDPAAFEAYLEAFPEGTFAPLARLRAGPAGADEPAAVAALPPAKIEEPREPPATAMSDAERLYRTLRDERGFRGVAYETRTRRWPFVIDFNAIDESTGELVGQIEWTTLGAVHEIRGNLKGTKLVFKETKVIKAGDAVLDCEYTLSLKSDDVMKGDFVCGRYGIIGLASFSLKQ
jgi:hypothetical protein